MTTYKGMDGFLSLGGYVAGYASVASAVLEGATQVTILGAQLTGVVLPGDTFTVAGAPGTYTVQQTVVAVDNQLVNVPFSPAAPAGGFGQGASVTFDAHSIAETRGWTATNTLQVLETTVQRQPARTRRTGLVEWQGTFEGFFDYGDPAQATLMQKFTHPPYRGELVGVSFTVTADGPVTLYGAAVLQTLAITSPGQELVSVTGTFQSTGGELVLDAGGTLEPVAIISPGPSTLPVRYIEPFDVESAPLPVAYLEEWEPAPRAPLTVQYTEPFDAE